jgi:hypothetical protein
MGDADGRRVFRADQVVGDTASLQWQQHGASSIVPNENCHCERSEAISMGELHEIASSLRSPQ